MIHGEHDTASMHAHRSTGSPATFADEMIKNGDAAAAPGG
jgi:hypothetical protein